VLWVGTQAYLSIVFRCPLSCVVFGTSQRLIPPLPPALLPACLPAWDHDRGSFLSRMRPEHTHAMPCRPAHRTDAPIHPSRCSHAAIFVPCLSCAAFVRPTHRIVLVLCVRSVSSFAAACRSGEGGGMTHTREQKRQTAEKGRSACAVNSLATACVRQQKGLFELLCA